MTQVAECIHVPLNTATGIVSRMEKRDLVRRNRSEEDKRVVTITFGETGREQIGKIIKKLLYYGSSVLSSFSPEELKIAEKMLQRVLEVIKEDHQLQEEERPKIRKIEII